MNETVLIPTPNLNSNADPNLLILTLVLVP